MALKVGTTSVVRLHKQLPNPRYVHYGSDIPTTELSLLIDYDPAGHACSTVGSWVGYVSPMSGTVYYKCEELYNPGQVEITHLKDNQNQTIHKRVTITFNANGGSGGSSQTRTWGVEQTTQPANPTRSGYDFQGWATTSGATSPNVTFPRATPENNITYYAVWKQQAADLTWRYQGTSSQPFCVCEGYNRIGTSCSSIGSTRVVCGGDIGRSGECHTVICSLK